MNVIRNFLTSRKFWAALVALVVVVLAGLQVSPEKLGFDQDALSGLLVIVGSYIVGVSLDPGTGWRSMFSSRKFWAALVGAVTMFVSWEGWLPIPSDTVVQIAVIIGSYIFGVAIEKPAVVAGYKTAKK